MPFEGVTEIQITSVLPTDCTNNTLKIESLPPEIISHIFVIGSQKPYVHQPDEYEDPDDDEDDAPHFATKCSHVCQYWRSVAIETPQLWSYLDFDEGPPFEKSKEWINRSKETPLTIQIDHTSDEVSPDEEREAQVYQDLDKARIIVSIVIPQAHRWKSFELMVDHYESIWLWQTELAAVVSAPILERLGLFCHEDWIEDDVFHPQELRPPLSLFPSGAPKLGSVSLWGVHFQWETAAFLRELVWLQLAWHTKDVRLTCEQFVQVLFQCPRLEVLALEGSAPLLGSWPPERIPLPALNALTITYIDVDDAISIVDHLDFPALTSLTLDLEAGSVNHFIRVVCKGNSPRFRHVESLKLTSFECTPAEGKRFLRTMPNITSLTLNFNYLPSHFQFSLSNPSIMCPKLHTLKLSGLDNRSVRSLIKARQKSPTHIQKLYLDQDDDYTESTIQWLKRKVETVQFYEASDAEDDEDEDESGDSEWDSDDE